MVINVINQKPAVLDPVHTIAINGAYDPMPAITKAIIAPLTTPLHPGIPVSITDGNGTDVSGGLPSALMVCLGDTVQASAEREMKSIFAQTLVHFDDAIVLPVDVLFASQAGAAQKLPTPIIKAKYTAAADVIPAAKGLLAGSGHKDEFFSSLAYAYNPQTLGFWFETEHAFDDFKTWLKAQAQLLSSVLPSTTTKLLSDFDAITLNELTESLQLRRDEYDQMDEYSFARVIVNMLMGYLRTQSQTVPVAGANVPVGLLPFSVSELFCPLSLVLVNVEAHARARAIKITNEWEMLNRALQSPVKIVSNQALSKLTALPRAAARAAALASMGNSLPQSAGRSAQITFRKQPASKLDLFKCISRVLKRMGTVNKSQNALRTVKSSFVRANRRDPDDYNKPGLITSWKYMPDIHIYVDNSGSISEVNYQEAVVMLIRIAKKLNVNLYFSSFSHVLSQETMLKIENKSVARIWQEFRKIPKVTGGTEFKQVWDYINQSPVRKKRLNLMITDFEWYPPRTRIEHPKNLFYAPCGAMNWQTMLDNAEDFAQAMRHIEPAIHQRLLTMVK